MTGHSKPVISLTGATGFLGSHLMNALLMNGYHVIALGRASGMEPLSERIFKLLRWFDNSEFPGLLETCEIDYQKPLLGLPLDKYLSLCAKTDQIIHCASDTSFSNRKRTQVIEFNVLNLSGILKFAEDSDTDFLHYISTAYVAGINGSPCREKLSTATVFTNVYEESKALAERIIYDSCLKNSIPFTFIRPTIVYGDSKTGRSLKFNALYHPIRSVLNIRDIYVNDIKYHGGKRSLTQGIHLQKNGDLYLPIRIYLPNRGGINLIPIDYFTEATLKIIVNPKPRGIYHLAHHNPAKFEDIACYNEKLMKIKGIEVIYDDSTKNSPRNPAEELFDRYIAPYRPYFSDSREFVCNNIKHTTENLAPAEFDYEIFKKCMEYAIKVDWGESLFQQN